MQSIVVKAELMLKEDCQGGLPGGGETSKVRKEEGSIILYCYFPRMCSTLPLEIQVLFPENFLKLYLEIFFLCCYFGYLPCGLLTLH